jgi:hypothetical protein
LYIRSSKAEILTTLLLNFTSSHFKRATKFVAPGVWTVVLRREKLNFCSLSLQNFASHCKENRDEVFEDVEPKGIYLVKTEGIVS